MGDAATSWTEEREEPEGATLPPRAVLLLLASVTLLVIFLSLDPLLTFGAWGSDSGEYASLTSALLTHHAFQLSGYTGWGFGYPYFPGLFEVGAAVSAATGADPLLSLELAVPTLGALGVMPLFLLFRRILPSDGVALLGAALSGVAAPRLLVLSHAAPVTLGDLLWIASLWAFVEQRKDPRWWGVLALTAPALILTHHLSSYFFLLTGLGLLVGLELYAPRRWTRRFPLPEFVFLGAFAIGLLTFWSQYALPFWSTIVLKQGLLSSPGTLVTGVVVGMLLFALLVRWRRVRSDRALASGRRASEKALWSLKFPTRSHVARDGLLLSALIVVPLSVLMVVPLPGTQDVAPPLLLLWYAPMIAYIPLTSGTRGVLPASRLGPGLHALIVAVGLSAIFSIVSASTAIPLNRHTEYLIPPLALITALGITRGLSALRDLRSVHSKVPYFAALASVVLLVAASGATAYPPPTLLEGFQEGFTPADLSESTWMAVSLPAGAHLASDHRLSDLYFYDSGGSPATWDNASCLFIGTDSYCAYAELQSSFLPEPPPPQGHGPPAGKIYAVAVDETMRTQGVALDPSQPAVPMSGAAQDRFAGPGFVELYSAGGQTVWWVVLSEVPSPP